MDQKLTNDITQTDVAIVGGGASGVAIAIHLIEQAKKGRALKKVMVIEKRDVLGPGLAFSTDCDGTILNMHSDTMGIYVENPRDYTHWRKTLENGLDEGPFPSRVAYGAYLQGRWAQTVEEARVLGVSLTAFRACATNIDKVDESAWEITLDNQSTLTACAVVLALGNFAGAGRSHLQEKPGFFPSPWPTTQLKSIPTNAHVLVIGSRLSAIDTALNMSDNGHKGPITFMSRNGKLPKVQGDPIPNPRRYILYELARQIEDTSDESALLRLLSTLAEEISLATGDDWSWMLQKMSPMEQLEADLTAAQEQRVYWQSVLNSTAPIIERYWRSLSLENQRFFMENINSSWMTYRHAMPIQNAKRILALLKRSQLQVVRGDSVSWVDGMFKATTSSGVLETRFVVDAAGQECQIGHIKSPLVQSAVSKGLLKSLASGGVEVDFHSLRAPSGLYVIGSMTKGTHFYVSATDRVAAHASRIAKSLTSEPFSHALHIAIFIGGDVSHSMVNRLVPRLVQAGHVPYLFLSSPTLRKRKGAPQGFSWLASFADKLSQFDNEFLQKPIIRHSGKSAENAQEPEVHQVASKYGLSVQGMPTNDKSFFDTMSKHFIDLGLLLSSSDDSTNDSTNGSASEYFSHDKRLLRLHIETSALCHSIPSALASKTKKDNCIYYLYEIGQAAASGRAVDVGTHPANRTKSSSDGAHALGIDMVLSATGKIARGEALSQTTEDACLTFHREKF